MALFGWSGTFYTLTFDEDHLPEKWRGGKQLWKNYMARLRYAKGGVPLDCISCLEGKHGDHRYHFHAIFNDDQISVAEARNIWRYGEVDDEPLLRQPRDSFRRLATYLNKERSDGVVIPVDSRPWTCSRSLTAKLPPPVRWMDTSGHIEIPDDVFASGRSHVENEFGVYEYAWYISPKNKSLILK